LTPAGRRQLHAAARNWNQMTSIIAGILSAEPDEV
jgi:hypothetical protein